MKKILLTLAITFVSTVDADDKRLPEFPLGDTDYDIERIDTGGAKFGVYCIQDYVFIGGYGSLTQVFRRGSEKMEIEAQPMKCQEYRKRTTK